MKYSHHKNFTKYAYIIGSVTLAMHPKVRLFVGLRPILYPEHNCEVNSQYVIFLPTSFNDFIGSECWFSFFPISVFRKAMVYLIQLKALFYLQTRTFKEESNFNYTLICVHSVPWSRRGTWGCRSRRRTCGTRPRTMPGPPSRTSWHY